MRTIEDVANNPTDGDVVVMRTGHIHYTVLRVAALNEVPSVDARRDGWREHSIASSQRTDLSLDGNASRDRVVIPLVVWRDLVLLGASTVSPAP